MKKNHLLLTALILTLLLSHSSKGQKTTVRKALIFASLKNDINSEAIPSATITVKDRPEKTFSDGKGNIRLAIGGNLPATLIISSIGYKTKEVEIKNATESLEINMTPSAMIQEEAVVSPTGTPGSFIKAPVSVDRINLTDIRNSATPNFYSGITHVKGVDVTTSGLLFETITTRGFNVSGNLRVNQFLDNMDNQAPGLNFSLGNLLGMTELDVESVELLPGASSALYGSGGLNGTLLMKSKNPFKYKGFSAQVKEGLMHVNDKEQGRTPYHDFSFRWAGAVRDKFAFKINAQLIKGSDWEAGDISNLSRNNLISKPKPGDRNSDPNYDGVNVYGDELNIDMYSTTQGIIYTVLQKFSSEFYKNTGRLPTDAEKENFISNHPLYKSFYWAMKNKLIPNQRVSRTGYKEADLVDYKTYNLKISGGLYYNLTPNIELSLIGYWGNGTTVYTGADRYSLKDVRMGQYKAELRNKNSFIRIYTTQENAGDAYNTTALASYINESWKSSQTWFPEYLGNYAGARLQGLPEASAHAYARSKADSGRLMPGTEAFNQQYERIRKTPISKQGALFLDKTDLWQSDAQVDLSEKLKFINLLVGANYKQYVLNSEGTLFADSTGRIKIGEWGGFAQLQKHLFNDLLTIAVSGRYDKSKNFKGQFTPRIAGLFKIGKDNNFRLSYQTAYRFPTTQDQYINLFTGTTTLIGSLPEFAKYYHFDENPIYTAQSISRFRETGNPTDLQKGEFHELKPETVKAVEFGYKTLIKKKVFIDLYAYFNTYNNFIGRVAVGQATTPGDYPTASANTSSYAYAQNANETVKSSGLGIGIEYKPWKNYLVRVNASSDKLRNMNSDFITFFNTSKYRFNLGLANENVWKRVGFNVNYRWQDKVNWEGTFGTGPIRAYGILDAMVSYKMTKAKTLFKIGASNVLNKYYSSAFGNPPIGGLYYASIGYNVF